MNVQSRNYCWSNKCSKPSTWYIKICEQGRHNRSHRKKQHSTISTKLNGAHHGVRPLVEIQILHFLLLFFDIFSDYVWRKYEVHQFLAQLDRRCGLEKFHNFSTKFKAPSRVWVRCLRSRIWASSLGQTQLRWVWWDVKFDSTQF
jgi:hypothetical protein